VTGVDGCGAALVAAVGLLGTALLVFGHRLRAAREQRAADARRVELARREADQRIAEAEAAIAAQEVASAERRVDDLAEVCATVRAMIERAEAVRSLCDGGPAA
jgi:hypothetical protein